MRTVEALAFILGKYTNSQIPTGHSEAEIQASEAAVKTVSKWPFLTYFAPVFTIGDFKVLKYSTPKGCNFNVKY